jgi:hypothetical protein
MMSQFDKEDYDEALERNKAMIEEMRIAVMDFDVYEHGMEVVDTDYDNFLMVFHCSEESLTNEQHNDNLVKRRWHFNKIKEEAKIMRDKYADQQDYQDWVKSIESNPHPSYVEMEAEVETGNKINEYLLMTLKDENMYILKDLWKKCRVLFTNQDISGKGINDFMPELSQVTHQSQMTLFSKNPWDITDDQFLQFKTLMKEKIGEWDFDASHTKQHQPRDVCPETDPFVLTSSMTYQEAIKRQGLEYPEEWVNETP